ncbi:hypothetical protein SZ47_10580 [Brachyspira hyodysenteriae]|uniref:Uncharacterized protein n=1 Tax=Brachyspira hyodysenteriae ATCC 27164 TaxID=1266923 RepID=A0A3B6VUX1_BRAHO|nr:hypothetical protein [Brachyspira hyodysenteriae]ANN64666.1 hypothetical protein BHYOB78_12590 [Brachyspira hyodysenteriae ATCC 27164]KLI23458.1 hypothetical protein SZ47_10580 [Brachyspira hyodysenteriae]MCZ9924169.1 hypothetical protein [Brachyspira hyodysenteriae]TVL82553.1 hypothetical protein A9X81_07945 [Brachyspira hyodysenteriae]TVL82935.1 hypothetical protein A9X80_10585 [Brachyspira hyodysenteriae]
MVKDAYNSFNILDLNGNTLISINNSNINMKEDNAWNNLKNRNYDFAITENILMNDSSVPYMIIYSGIKNDKEILLEFLLYHLNGIKITLKML